jgi:sec-independent protein translocase protein TatA
MLPLAFGFGGPWDIAIVAGVVILLFGGTKIPGFFKSLGDGITEFKKATTDDVHAVPPPPPATVTEPPVAIGAKTEEK